MTMKAIVTGAAGFIGSTLVDKLLGEGNEVVAVDNFDDYYAGKMKFLEPHLSHKDFKLHRIDILDLELLKRSFEGGDIVFHLAAQAGVRFSVANPLKVHNVNTTGTLNVLIAARDKGIAKVVNSSSSSVYGNATHLPVKEDDAPSPVSPYAVSKLAAEIYCRLFFELYGLPSVSLRYFTVYGPRQRPDMAIRIFTDRALRGLRPQIFGDGEQTRDFTFVHDAVDAIYRCTHLKNMDGSAMNICSGRTISVNKVVSAVLKATGREDLKPEYMPHQQGDVDHTWGDNAKARKQLGWEPRTDMNEALKKFVEWYVENRNSAPAQRT